MIQFLMDHEYEAVLVDYAISYITTSSHRGFLALELFHECKYLVMAIQSAQPHVVSLQLYFLQSTIQIADDETSKSEWAATLRQVSCPCLHASNEFWLVTDNPWKPLQIMASWCQSSSRRRF